MPGEQGCVASPLGPVIEPINRLFFTAERDEANVRILRGQDAAQVIQ